MRSVSGEARCASLAGGDGARARHLPQRWRGHAPAAWRRGTAGAKVAAHCSSSILETATRPKCSARSSARRRRGRPCRWRHAHPRAPCPLPMAAQVRAAAAGAAARASGAFSSGWPSRTAQRLSSCAPWVAPFRVCVFAVFVTVHTCVTVTHKSQPRTGHTRMPRPSSSLLHACRLPNAPASRLHGYTRPAFLPLSLRARRAPIHVHVHVHVHVPPFPCTGSTLSFSRHERRMILVGHRQCGRRFGRRPAAIGGGQVLW